MSSIVETKNYKWVALTNTTIGMLMVTINSSILLIALPNIFRGIKLNPLAPGNTSYFLWILMGFLLVTSVLVVSLGRVGDIFGRVKMYTLGFAIFTAFSILLSATWMTGPTAAIWIILMRLGQGVGGAFIFANSSAIITDAFPADERGFALGINGVAAIGGSFLGLLLGGLLGPIQWHLVFLVSVPFGLFGTLWAYFRLHDNGIRIAASIDWIGNVLFAVGLVGVLTGIVYGLQPYGGHTMGWTSPFVLACLVGGVAVLLGFVIVERHVDDPMFQLKLFRSRSFAMGNLAGLMAALARGGLQFMLIIWLQGIWLPLHGYSFEQTPLWAGIYMIPLTVGFFISGPLAGKLADRYGPRPFATAGLVMSGLALIGLQALPMNFPYPAFAALLLLVGLALGLFAAPNTERGHEQPAGQPARGRGRHAEHVPELGQCAVDRLLLHGHHPGTGRGPAHGPADRAHRPGGTAPRRSADLPPLTDRQPVRRLPRDQPRPPAARQPAPLPTGGARLLPHRAQFLPPPDLGPVREGPPPRLPGGRRALLHRGGLLVAAGRWTLRGDALDRRGRRGGSGHRRRGGHGRGRRLNGAGWREGGRRGPNDRRVTSYCARLAVRPVTAAGRQGGSSTCQTVPTAETAPGGV